VVVGAGSPRQDLTAPRAMGWRTLPIGFALVAASVMLADTSASAQAITDTLADSTIKVATIGDFDANGVDNSQWIDAVRARFDAANAHGGVMTASRQRHPIEVIACNAASDLAQTIRCAEQAVDQRVVAVVGLTAVYGDRALPILGAARIPALGVRVNALGDAAQPASFPLASGMDAELMAMPQLLAKHGATRIAVIISDFGPATDDAVAVLQQGRALTSAGSGPVVRVAPGTTDYTAAVADAIQPGVDGVVGFVAGGTAGTLERQLRAANYTGRYVTRAPWGSAPAASDADPSIPGTLVVGHFPPPTSADVGWTQFRRDLELPRRQLGSVDEGTINAWLAARAFEHLLGSVDLVALKTAVLEPIVYNSGNDTGGLTPPLSSTTSDAELPRLFNRAVTFSITRSGTREELDKRFFDPFRGRFLR
jgi:ABC-type branched-subunit amino acid transport system substrate-binding protein